MVPGHGRQLGERNGRRVSPRQSSLVRRCTLDTPRICLQAPYPVHGVIWAAHQTVVYDALQGRCVLVLHQGEDCAAGHLVEACEFSLAWQKQFCPGRIPRTANATSRGSSSASLTVPCWRSRYTSSWSVNRSACVSGSTRPAIAVLPPHGLSSYAGSLSTTPTSAVHAAWT
jgi:hypothetical protein